MRPSQRSRRPEASRPSKRRSQARRSSCRRPSDHRRRAGYPLPAFARQTSCSSSLSSLSTSSSLTDPTGSTAAGAAPPERSAVLGWAGPGSAVLGSVFRRPVVLRREAVPAPPEEAPKLPGDPLGGQQLEADLPVPGHPGDPPVQTVPGRPPESATSVPKRPAAASLPRFHWPPPAFSSRDVPSSQKDLAYSCPVPTSPPQAVVITPESGVLRLSRMPRITVVSARNVRYKLSQPSLARQAILGPMSLVGAPRGASHQEGLLAAFSSPIILTCGGVACIRKRLL